MPRRLLVAPGFSALVESQDFVVHRTQALSNGLTPRAVAHRLAARMWRLLLPDVYLTHPGDPSRRQKLIAALLYAGPDAAIDDVDALHFYGVRAVNVDDNLVRVVVPEHSSARSRGFVVVRRTRAPIAVVSTERARYLNLAAALMATTRRAGRPQRVLAILSDAVQRRLVTFDELLIAHIQATRRNAKFADDALEHIAAGVRSAPEGGFRTLATASLVLPPLLCNCVLRLPGGEYISPDALAVDAGLVHETNGRSAHERFDLFEDTMVRQTVMTTAGLIVIGNSPTRIDRRGRQVLAEFEQCYLKYQGRGMPDGVEIVRESPLEDARTSSDGHSQLSCVAVGGTTA
jgi:hypothetical protein